jgi:cytochrome c
MSRLSSGTCVLLLALSSACNRAEERDFAAVPDSNAERGRRAMEHYGCGSCHTIPSVDGASALVGPSLEHMGNRSYVAGVLVNRPENLVAWILDPPGIDPKTAMPHLGVTEQDARDIASYLYTLR